MVDSTTAAAAAPQDDLRTNLVLTRDVDQTIEIFGGMITVTICHATSGRVKLGIRAPREVSIDRGEILARKRRPNAEG